jgi:hypothetical protein
MQRTSITLTQCQIGQAKAEIPFPADGDIYRVQICFRPVREVPVRILFTAYRFINKFQFFEQGQRGIIIV